ncbi:TonB-dependent receptor [Niabella drilacis]|uniref:Outer membrane receptor for ferrienterochelin and colicins n=1 Tax=Niabella drilacis (strain DSM 25811 / CCM 8410 / CCUG 62505 / LMG 26954 / E90) TaxID=1285928 RepID=A0A1G6S313_NIADE|nr:TonB-dependent receptor [Niabella drilacis]SDD10575.1 outer membrane receptor for ferrienterochelin and colicins [Niabella drilacis]
MRFFFLALQTFLSGVLTAQTRFTATGTVFYEGHAVAHATVRASTPAALVLSDTNGYFRLPDLPSGKQTLTISAAGFQQKDLIFELRSDTAFIIHLERAAADVSEVVVSGTLKTVSRQDSPVPVEVYTSAYFRANPTPSLFDALQNINGVRPQLNCNICNTGDIHINGLEGPYTLVLIDGMPIVSGLSTVYGLSGIPQSLIERVEIVKGPASTLYGSEAVGGLVNIITHKPGNTPALAADVFATSWQELNADIASSFSAGKNTRGMAGVNYFNYSTPADRNRDGFTDVTLQNRFSAFSKWEVSRRHQRLLSMATRYVQEDRWGGEMNWNKTFRGGDSIYGESIDTRRWELFGTYELPLPEKILLWFSANGHYQNSAYGNIPFNARQYIGFLQLTWNKTLHRQDLTTGATLRYTYYDDNTPATTRYQNGMERNRPEGTWLPGLFIQDELLLGKRSKLLAGLRYDHHSIHGGIITPRLNYKWNSLNRNNTLRLGIGNGYRVAQVFTEDHAALTGARDVVFKEALKPETSWNGNINFVKRIITSRSRFIGLDATAFYTYFINKIIADYDNNPNQILYQNLNGHAVSRGVSLNIDLALLSGLKVLAGATYMDVYSIEGSIKTRQLFTEKFTGVWNLGYQLRKWGCSIEYTGNVYGPMRLPLLSATDPRASFSPWWSIQNLQLSKKMGLGIEVYGGVKNLLNFTPDRSVPFLIARANDPFDKQVRFDDSGRALVTPDNPYGLTFDPTYVYAPNQGIRGFLGVRWRIDHRTSNQ